jgi:hypothetical protein
MWNGITGEAGTPIYQCFVYVPAKGKKGWDFEKEQ